MARVFNLARMNTATTGTGAITLGSAVAGFLSFSAAGVTDGMTLSYGIKDGSSSEVGRGAYSSSGTQLTRSVLRSTNSNNPINLSGSAEVFITAVAEDFGEWGKNHDANGFNLGFDNATGILDDSSNEQLIFGKTASAVNNFRMTNAATGNAPALSAEGDDTNININLVPKGTGVVQAGGAAVATVGKQTIWVPAVAMTPRITNGPSVGSLEQTTNKNMFRTLDFDATTQEFAQFEVHMPKSWDLGTITFQPVWSHASTSVNFGVVWALQAVARSDGDAGDVAFGTEQTSTDTGGTANTIYIGPESSAMTSGGTPSAGDTVQFQLKRNPSDGSDTMAVDARLHGVRVFFTTNAPTDA